MGGLGRRVVLGGLLGLWAAGAGAQTIVKTGGAVGALYTPSVGSAERSAIMDAARVPIGKVIVQPVVFLVSVLNSDGHWAYLGGTPQNRDGSPIDWLRTPLAEEWKQGVMSDEAMVLLRNDGAGWQVVDYVMGPTDVFWIGWMQDYGLPERLFE
ncbi:MAG: hypothetical protein NTX73_04810 [Rhodobacterales bacterium]|nr:hypothetical protein [Rhodobacterales bacterium]